MNVDIGRHILNPVCVEEPRILTPEETEWFLEAAEPTDNISNGVKLVPKSKIIS